VSIKEALIAEIEDMPEALLFEVLQFVHFLKWRSRREVLEVTLLSEAALAKDWLTPEEDEAWRDL